jgi:hypothetical protein
MWPGARVASMGYPDIIARRKDLESVLGSNIYRLKYRKDSSEISQWHKVKLDIPDAHSFFELQGATLDVFDVVEHRGGEIVVDLNYPVEAAGRRPYDFVLDIGTLEHCFNIGQAALNMAALLAAGGLIFHENPFNWANHGFYNINPTWYADFYRQDGFELLDMRMIARDGMYVENVPPTKRFMFMAAEANMAVLARRNVVRPIGFPVQSKYADLIPAAGARAMATPA